MPRHKAQRREAAGARRVVFEQIKSDGQSIEQPFRNLFVAAFGVPVTAAIAPAKVHADIHVLRRGGEQAVGHRDIFVNERAPIVAARGERALYLGIAEFGKSGFVDLDVTATRRRKGAKLRRESVDRIGPELIHVVICACRYRGIAAAEVQRARPRNRDLRPAVRVGRIDRMVPLHAAADNRDRLRAATASPVRANSVGAANRIDAQLPKRAVEKAVIERRRNSPSVTNLKPNRSCSLIASAVAASSAAASAAASISPLAKRARSRSKLAGRSRVPICSARNGGLAAAASATACERSVTKLPRYLASSPRPLLPSLPIRPTALPESGCRSCGAPLRCGCRVRQVAKFHRIQLDVAGP